MLELDWHFAQPSWFALLLLWPIVQFIIRPWRARLNPPTTSAVFYHPRIAAFFKKYPSTQKQTHVPTQRWGHAFSFVLKTLILISLLAALAQPQRLIEQAPDLYSPPQRDIALVIESSVTFVLPDYQIDGQSVSRMDVVRSVLDQFISELPQDRFSITLYAEHAYTLVPMSADRQAVRAHLPRLQPYLAGRTDPAMGEALGLALREVDKDSDGIEKRIVVLVSDGLHSQSRIELDAIVDYAQSLSVPIYTIGIGAGSAQADQRQYAGLLYQPIETASLKFLAQHTGGEFYQVGGQGDLAHVLKQIETNEGVVRQDLSHSRWQTEALYPYPLTLALSLFALWWLVTLGGHRWNS